MTRTAKTAASVIKADEVVLLFPTSGWYSPAAQAWHLDVHGWIFEPEVNSLRRRALLQILQRVLKLDSHSEQTELFRQRVRMFLVDNERRKRVPLRVGGWSFTGPPSRANGHFETTITVPEEVVDAAAVTTPNGRRFVTVYVDLPADDQRTFCGTIELIPARGVSIVSDIDDTIKVSDVADRRQLVANTFLKEFRPVEGMSDAYRRWEQQGAVFHYVSVSPWQLFTPLKEMLNAAAFPVGTLQLRKIRVRDLSQSELFVAPIDLKQRKIEALLRRFVRREFLLCGDSGQFDPELYGKIARTFGSQIRGIHIRNVNGASADDPRFREAFRDVPPDRWSLFDSPGELLSLAPGA